MIINIIRIVFYAIVCLTLGQTVWAADWVPMEDLKKAPHKLYEECTIKRVPQSRVAYYTGWDSVHGFESTSGGPCVILAARHRPSGAGFAAHVASFSEIDPCTWSGTYVSKRLKKLIKINEPGYFPGSAELTLSDEADVVDFYVLGGCCCTSCPLKVSVERFIDHVDSNIKTVDKVYYMDACRSWSPRVLIDFKTGNYYQYDPRKDPLYQDPSLLSTLGYLTMTLGSVFIFGLCEI